MKSLSRILAICLCAAPVVHGAWGVVATNSGSNLTAFNPSNAYNNQWATLSNGRGDVAPTAKVNFGNCNSLILRCAQPKCGNGGCTDMNVASAIVAGCVQSNKSCEQYGDDLVSYMSAQLVANSNAKINAQNAAAAQAAQAAQQEQINAMQQEMQQQMAQMQQQMAQQSAQMQQQNEQTQQQIQAALDQQAQQNQAALNNMASAATATTQQTESGITSYQQEAIDRGVSNDVLERQKITGQIMTEIEDAENSLKTVKTAMNDAFEYAGCDARGNNCTGPKRVKKFRERALNFIDPYDNVIDKIYDALSDAQVVGVDLSEIYLLLNDSCNRWGEYLCPQGVVHYSRNTNNKGQKSEPVACEDNKTLLSMTGGVLGSALYSTTANDRYNTCVSGCVTTYSGAGDEKQRIQCINNCGTTYCDKCTLLKTLTDNDDVYKGWVNAETTSTENQTVVACASAALDDSYIGRRSRRKKGTGVVDIDLLELWLSQTEPSMKTTKKNNVRDFLKYCFGEDGVADFDENETTLQQASLSKSIVKKYPLCVDNLGSLKGFTPAEDEGCSYISPIYALCDTHMYNAGETDPEQLKKDVNLRSTIKQIVALKSTVVAQQMYKQYEFLAATLRRLKIHLEKSVLSANLQAAGGFSNGGSSSGGSSSGGRNNSSETHVVLNDAESCSDRLDFKDFAECLQSNVTLIKDSVNSNSKQACLQLQYTLDEAHNRFIMENFDGVNILTGGRWTKCKDFFDKAPTAPKFSVPGDPGDVHTGKTCKISSKDKSKIIGCANEIMERANAIKRKLGV